MKFSFSITDRFRNRHIGPNAEEAKEMLKVIGADSLDTLVAQTIPASIRLKKPLDLPPAVSEYEYLQELKARAGQNKLFRNFIGMGYYETIVPPVIQRNILENPGWYTQYTPYQAEIAQGRLEALLNFQTMVSDLTGMELANASLLDEGTAAAEAMIMLYNEKNKRNKGEAINKFYVDEQVFPQTLDVLRTRAIPLGIELVVADPFTFKFDETTFGLLVQYPGSTGEVRDFQELFASATANGIFTVVAADLLALVLLKAPAEIGADVVVGNTQRFGVPMGYGGPHAAYFATHEKFKRQIPGRIIGVSVDANGKPGLRMALQTREQHIKREKATSNICTAQALLAIMAGMYAVYHGPEGLKQIATRIHGMTKALATEVERLGFKIESKTYVDDCVINVGDTASFRNLAEAHEINVYYIDAERIHVAVGETHTTRDLDALLEVFAKHQGKKWEGADWDAIAENMEISFPENLARNTAFLEHPVFNQYHSETEMMRYIKRLENRDLSLTTSMIALGSCTMKLNAAAELFHMTWPGFSSLHPFVPADQAEGYRKIIAELSDYLSEITGFAATSLQPNSGAQGEYAGLLTIRAYHLDRGDTQRDIALIPSSAHGTNPASAIMAGMKVVVTACDEMGNIDVEDLRKNADEYKDRLACLMVTYPSTHGVFEEAIIEICNIIHERGGLVYMDGANMNAQVGLTSPANIGADVCHLNLHKTFAIPHGGGGPGMGPICVNEKLKPFLPGHPLVETGGEKAIPAVSAAPWGSASILLISYAYIRMLGATGMTEATKYAILNANYLKARLAEHYSILYTGKNGRVAHEFIMDFRQWKHSLGVEVEDVAKRLMDYSYHAPTVSFPVPGTMMIEPTESESLAELDRFISAMLSIRQEIEEVANGTADPKDNILKHAPHTAAVVMADNWERPYSRERAAFPVPYLSDNKFWPAVGRINNTYGDRNLVCTCPPMEAYAEPVK